MSLSALAAYGSSSSEDEAEKNCSNVLRSQIVKKGNKVKILAPKKIKYESSDDEDYGAPPVKKSNFSKVSSEKSSTSGLFSKLPAPNSSFGGIKSSSSSLMMPYVLTKKKPVNAKPKIQKPREPVQKKVLDKESDDEDEVPFFSFHEKSEIDNLVPNNIESQNQQHTYNSLINDNVSQPKSDHSAYSNSYSQNSYNVPYSQYGNSEDNQSSSLYNLPAPVHEPKTEDSWLNSKEYKKFLGKNSKEQINFIDVNADDALEGNKQMLLANLTKEASMQRQSHSKKVGGPTQRQKSKHQLSYLIHQAKANEIQLQEQWAAGKAKRDAAKMRYGF